MAMALPIAAAVIGVVGQLSKAQSASAGYTAQSQAMGYAAEVNRQRAQVAYEQGAQQEDQSRRDARQHLAQMSVSAVESGGAQGSGADLIGQSASRAELDALNIRYGADLQARGALNEATLDQYSSQVARNNASYAKSAGWLNAGSSALSSYARGYGGGS